MSKDAVSKTVQRAIIGGFWYTRNPPDVTGPSHPDLTQAPVPHVNSIDVFWVNGIDAQSGIASTYAEISPNGLGVWTRTVLAWPAASTTFTGLTSATAYDIRLANVDASANANVSPYSAVATVSTLGSPIDLAPGTLALTVSSVTVNEGGSLSLGVARSGAGTASPDTSVDWQFGGLNQGSPSPANGTLTWIGGDNSTQFIVTTAGAVTSTQTGILRLLNPRAASGNITPTLGLASVPVTIIADVISGIKWVPGYYYGSQNPTFADDRKLQQQVTEQNLVLSSGANVLGWNGYYYPAALESAPGVFDFSKVLRDSNRLRSMSTPKRLMITVIAQFYGSVNYGAIVPPTIVNTSSYGASPVAGKYGWWSAQGNTSAVLAFWRPAVMDWVISMFQAMAATVNPSTGLTIDADPYLVSTSFNELAVGVDAGDATFSLTALVTQYKRLIDAINIVWPTTVHICQNNLSISSASFAQDMTNYCYANRTAIGGPDTFAPGQRSPLLTGGQAACLGVASGVAGFTGPDLRGKAALMFCTQGPEISVPGRYKMFTPHTFFTEVNGSGIGQLSQGVMIITGVNINATTDPIPAYPADGPNTAVNPGNWHSMLQVINGSPLTHIAKPTSLVTTPIPPPAADPWAAPTPTSNDVFFDPTRVSDGSGTQGSPFNNMNSVTRWRLLASGRNLVMMNSTGAGGFTPIHLTSMPTGTPTTPICVYPFPGHVPLKWNFPSIGCAFVDMQYWRFFQMNILSDQNGVRLGGNNWDGTGSPPSGNSLNIDFVDPTGTRAAGSFTDNSALICMAYESGTGIADYITIVRPRLTGPAGQSGNQSLIWADYMRHFQLLGASLSGSANPLYFKHTDQTLQSNLDLLVQNSIMINAGRKIPLAANCVRYINNAIGSNFAMDEDGGGLPGGNNCFLSHNTFLTDISGNNDQSMAGNVLQDNALALSARVMLDYYTDHLTNSSNYSACAGAGTAHFGRNHSTYTLSAYKAAFPGQEVNGVSGTLTLVGGSTPGTTAANWALTPGSVGIGTASDGTNIGVDAAKLLTVNS